jgi:hypothetical protein
MQGRDRRKRPASDGKSLPHSSSATPRRKIAAPMVMMMVVTTDAPSGRFDGEPLQQQSDQDREQGCEGGPPEAVLNRQP